MCEFIEVLLGGHGNCKPPVAFHVHEATLQASLEICPLRLRSCQITLGLHVFKCFKDVSGLQGLKQFGSTLLRAFVEVLHAFLMFHTMIEKRKVRLS